jgi:hypothetical protein
MLSLIQPHQNAQPQEPGDETEQGHHHGCEAGDLRVTLRISVSHRRNGISDH